MEVVEEIGTRRRRARPAAATIAKLLEEMFLEHMFVVVPPW